jgi:hypothetical protein
MRVARFHAEHPMLLLQATSIMILSSVAKELSIFTHKLNSDAREDAPSTITILSKNT